MNETMMVAVEADVAPLADALQSLEKLSEGFGRQMTGALRGATVGGRELDEVLRSVAGNLAGMALTQGLSPLQNLTGSWMSSLLGSLAGKVTPFAKGGVVNAPSYFPLGGGIGLMGEAGAEAIMPLRRGADGALGVAMSGGGQPVNVTLNVNATDAASFRKSEAQITTMLARAVSRGARGL
ncbi:phage tail tape measure protein [Limoniibacter endophyticus]|uniref:Tail protein n=1 Tax=Limoniibacter endophyticus TaxID=1565040 RepID=A0A8J3DNX6_9HYPH|nr:phage tail tape measure protein [Limoniibacter endophyticus]GHC69301.1 tail protein [Limoniibacter endophyticus]